MNAELLEAALYYASRGWPVFPLYPGSKRPACPTHTADRCDRTDPFCRYGHTGWEQRATTDPGRIRRGWSSRPYGIGIACGPASLLVLDTDVHKPGDEIPTRWQNSGVSTGETVLADLAAGCAVPDTLTVATPSGGFHRYYLAPAAPQLGNTTGGLGWLIDTRGRGGYVVAPPTPIEGTAYSLVDDLPLAWLPDWIGQALAGHRVQANTDRQPATARPVSSSTSDGYAAAALAGETAHVRAATPGKRNHTLFCAAVALGQLVAGGQLDEHAVRFELREACVDHILAGAFTAAGADATITSGLARGATQPRTPRPPTGRTAA